MNDDDLLEPDLEGIPEDDSAEPDNANAEHFEVEDAGGDV